MKQFHHCQTHHAWPSNHANSASMERTYGDRADLHLSARLGLAWVAFTVKLPSINSSSWAGPSNSKCAKCMYVSTGNISSSSSKGKIKILKSFSATKDSSGSRQHEKQSLLWILKNENGTPPLNHTAIAHRGTSSEKIIVKGHRESYEHETKIITTSVWGQVPNKMKSVNK